MRTTKARERGHEIHAITVNDAGSERLHVCGALDDAQSVAQPLYDGASDENASLQRVACVRTLPGDGRQQSVLRVQRTSAGIHERKAPCTVGILGHTGLEAVLAKERSLLVPDERSKGGFAPRQGRRQISRDSCRSGYDLRQARVRDAEEFEERRIPFAGVQIKKQCAARVGRVGHVTLAASQLPREPAVDRAKGEFATFGTRACTGYVLEEPGEFGGREIRIEQQSCTARDFWLVSSGAQLCALPCGTPVLPYDRARDRAARDAIPQHGRLALIGNADGRDIGERSARLGEYFSD